MLRRLAARLQPSGPESNQPLLHTMNILRLEDLAAQGKLANQRVFIRADMNVPQDPLGPPHRRRVQA